MDWHRSIKKPRTYSCKTAAPCPRPLVLSPCFPDEERAKWRRRPIEGRGKPDSNLLPAKSKSDNLPTPSSASRRRRRRRRRKRYRRRQSVGIWASGRRKREDDPDVLVDFLLRLRSKDEDSVAKPRRRNGGKWRRRMISAFWRNRSIPKQEEMRDRKRRRERGNYSRNQDEEEEDRIRGGRRKRRPAK